MHEYESSVEEVVLRDRNRCVAVRSLGARASRADQPGVSLSSGSKWKILFDLDGRGRRGVYAASSRLRTRVSVHSRYIVRYKGGRRSESIANSEIFRKVGVRN